MISHRSSSIFFITVKIYLEPIDKKTWQQYYEQRRNTKKSSEENRHGDELEKTKKETALNNGYFIASLFLSLLAISCYLGITNGNIIIFSKRIDLADVLWFIIFLSSAIEYGTKYVYLKQKRDLFIMIFWLLGLVGCLLSIAKS